VGLNVLNPNDEVMTGKPTGDAAWLGKTASLAGATQHHLRAFQSS
jgi:hypothetical protein